MQQGTVSISGANGAGDLRELADWLRADDIFHGQIHLDEKPIQSSHMGGLTEAIIIAVGRGGLANTLVRQIFTWLARREHRTVRLTLKDGTGREAILDVN